MAILFTIYILVGICFWALFQQAIVDEWSYGGTVRIMYRYHVLAAFYGMLAGIIWPFIAIAWLANRVYILIKERRP